MILLTLQKIMDMVSPLWGICPYSAIEDNLIKCRAESRLPEKPESIIVACFPYLLDDECYEGRNISRYAVVTDYHEVAIKRLQKAADALSEIHPQNKFSVFADNSPIPEVKAACHAGLGVRGLNSLLITKEYGSYVFIGEIVTDLKLEADKNDIISCIKCGKCILSCPAEAIFKDNFDKESCLSAVTQKKGELSDKEKQLMKECGCIWGCDICQESCPMNINTEKTEIEEFLSSPVATVRSGCELSGRAYEWRGRRVIERNITVIHE